MISTSLGQSPVRSWIALDRGRGFDGRRRHLEHALVGLDRALGVAELALLDLGATEQQRDLEIVLLRLVRDLIVERDDLGPLVEASGEAIELAVGHLVARILTHRARVRSERGVGVVAADLVQLRDHVEQLDLAGRIEGVLRHDLVHADLLGPLAARLVDRLEDVRDRELVLGIADQALERVHRIAVLILDVEDLAIRLDGRSRLVEVRLAQLGEANEQRDLLVRSLDERELTADVVAEIAPLLALDVQPIERAQRLQVIRATGRGSPDRC